MIKIDMDANKKCTICVAGPQEVIAADIGYVIESLYNGFKDRDTQAAESFKRMIQIITEEDSPVWSEKDTNQYAEFKKVSNEETLSTIEELIQKWEGERK